MSEPKELFVPTELPPNADAFKEKSAAEYLQQLAQIPTMSEHTATEKWASFHTGFKYGYTFAQSALAEIGGGEE